MSDILYGLVLGVATLLVVAVVHKIRALHARRAAAEPVIAANRALARAPRAALGAAAVVEVALTIGVLLAPITVTLGIALLLGVYVVALRALPESSSCHCFGAVLDVGRSDAILRNVATGGICGSPDVSVGR